MSGRVARLLIVLVSLAIAAAMVWVSRTNETHAMLPVDALTAMDGPAATTGQY